MSFNWEKRSLISSKESPANTKHDRQEEGVEEGAKEGGAEEGAEEEGAEEE